MTMVTKKPGIILKRLNMVQAKQILRNFKKLFQQSPRDWSICSNMSMGLIGGLMPMKKLPFSFWGLT
ncbi:hypothetical protein D3C73_636400 [compost metagenome]